jgi:RimJ/RimL family protein N-acetyltransferase
VNPILFSLPKLITTARLIIRTPFPGDGVEFNNAIHESSTELKEWLPWAQTLPTMDESEVLVREFIAEWILRKNLHFFIFEKSTQQFLGDIGMHHIDWMIPKFEIGFWMRTSKSGKGFTTEATNAILHYCFEVLEAKRVEIRCSTKNLKSQAVMKKLNLTLDATLKNSIYNPHHDRVDDTHVYSTLDAKQIPQLEISWS